MATLLTKKDLLDKIEEMMNDVELMGTTSLYCPLCRTLYSEDERYGCWCDYESNWNED